MILADMCGQIQVTFNQSRDQGLPCCQIQVVIPDGGKQLNDFHNLFHDGGSQAVVFADSQQEQAGTVFVGERMLVIAIELPVSL
ncbi:Uncharacterised protein [uncultured Eubacterium sp.]|nr:Uncharacterised protein [uncultured Eubacterium sp.]